MSVRTRDDVPDIIKNGSEQDWIKWIEDRNDKIKQDEEDRKRNEFFEDINETAELVEVKQRKSFHGDVSTQLRSDGDRNPSKDVATAVRGD